MLEGYNVDESVLIDQYEKVESDYGKLGLLKERYPDLAIYVMRKMRFKDE